MPRDIAPLTSALEDATPGDQSDVYSLLAAWNESIETALDRGGWSRFQDIVGQYLEEVIDLVDTAATVDGIDWAWESTAAFGWAVGHPEVAVLDRALERAERVDDSWAMGILTHATFADPETGIDLLERLLESPDVVEDLLFVRQLDPPFEQDFPDFPQYWEPDTELDYGVEISDDVHERLLAVIGQSTDPDRLRHFDDSYRFDLEQAADEYGPGNDA